MAKKKSIKNDGTIRFAFDFTPNMLKSPYAEKQIEAQIKKGFTKLSRGMLERGKKIHPYITDRVGPYLDLLREARLDYELGLFYSTISMVGITAERFAIELTSKLRFKVNNSPISRNEIFGDKFNQYKRLRMLHKAKLLSSKMFKNLDAIRDIRNKYIHPNKKGNPEKDSLKALNFMIDSLQSDFSDKYTIVNGKIVPKSA